MMIVSKIKVILCRCIMWGGIGLAVLGAILFYVGEPFGMVCIYLLGGGLVLSLLGATVMRALFRCPNCRKNVLGEESGVDLRSSKCPDRCPHCGTGIQLKG